LYIVRVKGGRVAYRRYTSYVPRGAGIPAGMINAGINGDDLQAVEHVSLSVGSLKGAS
jgi:hypothetical protein